jgi:hypothetical protein
VSLPWRLAEAVEQPEEEPIESHLGSVRSVDTVVTGDSASLRDDPSSAGRDYALSKGPLIRSVTKD